MAAGLVADSAADEDDEDDDDEDDDRESSPPVQEGSFDLSVQEGSFAAIEGPRRIEGLYNSTDSYGSKIFVEAWEDVGSRARIWYTFDSKNQTVRHERNGLGVQSRTLGKTKFI